MKGRLSGSSLEYTFPGYPLWDKNWLPPHQESSVVSQSMPDQHPVATEPVRLQLFPYPSDPDQVSCISRNTNRSIPEKEIVIKSGVPIQFKAVVCDEMNNSVRLQRDRGGLGVRI